MRSWIEQDRHLRQLIVKLDEIYEGNRSEEHKLWLESYQNLIIDSSQFFKLKELKSNDFIDLVEELKKIY
jgi:hypothetical protein